MIKLRLAGGCQCGAIRYAVHEQPRDPHICHCRMCQKAFGSFFAPLAVVPIESFELTRGQLATFRSSDITERGFCRDCGTPLTLQDIGDDRMFFSIGSLDHPEAIRPARECGIEGKLPYFDTLTSLPGDVTTEDTNPELARKIAATNRQHPDRDTESWPPA